MYCRVIAEGLGLDRDFVNRIAQTSPLHDVGKVAVPDAILCKPGLLTPEERKVMQQHCVIGAAILRHGSDALLQALAFDPRAVLAFQPGPPAVEDLQDARAPITLPDKGNYRFHAELLPEAGKGNLRFRAELV